MNNLQPITFLMPVIALILSFIFYLFLKNKATNEGAFKRFICIVAVLAFFLNFFWEILQMPLYKSPDYNFQSISFCALASLADVIMVLLLYMCFALFYPQPLMVQHFTFFGVLLVMLIGAIGAIVIEMMYVSSGSWAYGESMPIIPVVNAGLSPVLQFMILPVLIYYTGFKILRYKEISEAQFDVH
ncbi:MAG: hypothetical protein H7096_05000 [Flavobacterium sp.]|nr:hypothetical protein [Pedobacter sp.]